MPLPDTDLLAGLSSGEAKSRLEQVGPNALEEKRRSTLLELLSYFWGPIPWMIEVAALLSVVTRDWGDVTIILILLFFNALVGFFQEHQAANAVEALKKQLALKARVRRDGEWQSINARLLVPGDIVHIGIGEIIPADVVLRAGDSLSVDQSALTGESLPVEKKVGEECYSGSIAKRGEMVAQVTATGEKSYFGRTAKLVAGAETVSHFQKAVLRIGDYLIYLSLALALILVVAQIARGDSLLTLFQFALILIVASIPIAMPAVLSVTMAVGALSLAKMKAILTRLESIEEMAGMDILCSDKTGTLTKNELTLGRPVLVGATSDEKLIAEAAWACDLDNPDAIDAAVLAGLKTAPDKGSQLSFVPFDPVSKRTEAEIRGPKEESYRVTKGAPQVILALCHPDRALSEKIAEAVNQLAGQGYRTLGVACQKSGGRWTFSGILPLYDPPRDDSAETIAKALEYGIHVKMVTGDNVAIARQVGSQLHMGSEIQPAGDLFDPGETTIISSAAGKIERADGYAQVFPEHKYGIVKALQERGHIVGMTGDGVNDAPALKQANTGIAVSSATDAARAAADLVLTAPGLSVIVSAVEQARRIFERMNSYAIYRITETIRIMFFVVLTMLVFGFYPITAVMIILLALFNDFPMMAIAYDNTWLDPKPVRWQMERVLSVSTVLGLVGVIETFGILVLGLLWLKLDQAQIQTLIFLKLSIAGRYTLFVARTQKPFFRKPYPASVLLWAVVGTQILVTILAGVGLNIVAPLSWWLIGFVWLYCTAWLFIEDQAKLYVYHHLNLTGKGHRRFLARIKRSIHGI